MAAAGSRGGTAGGRKEAAQTRVDRVGAVDLQSLIVLFMISKVFIVYQHHLARRASTAAWIVIILSALLTLAGWWAVSGLLMRHPGKSLIRICSETCGPWLGGLFGLIYLAIFLGLAAWNVRLFAESLIATILPQTPISALVFTLMASVYWFTALGLETMARTARIVFLIVLTFLGIILLLSFSSGAELTYLLPVLGPGIGPILGLSLHETSLFAELIFLAHLAPALRDPSELRPVGFRAIIITAIVLTAFQIAFQATFPVPGAAEQPLALLVMTKLIAIGRFIQRIEAIFFIGWIMAAGLKLASATYGAATVFAEMFSLPSPRPVIPAMVILSTGLALAAESMLSAMDTELMTIGTWGGPYVFLVPLVVMLVERVRSRRQEGLRHAS